MKTDCKPDINIFVRCIWEKLFLKNVDDVHKNKQLYERFITVYCYRIALVF